MALIDQSSIILHVHCFSLEVKYSASCTVRPSTVFTSNSNELQISMLRPSCIPRSAPYTVRLVITSLVVRIIWEYLQLGKCWSLAAARLLWSGQIYSWLPGGAETRSHCWGYSSEQSSRPHQLLLHQPPSLSLSFFRGQRSTKIVVKKNTIFLQCACEDGMIIIMFSALQGIRRISGWDWFWSVPGTLVTVFLFMRQLDMFLQYMYGSVMPMHVTYNACTCLEESCFVSLWRGKGVEWGERDLHMDTPTQLWCYKGAWWLTLLLLSLLRSLWRLLFCKNM